MKILIIPSWYPSRDNSVLGSFFKEQAELLSNNGYDIKILYGNSITFGFKYLIKNIFNLLFFQSKKIALNNAYLIQKPPAFSFSIFLFNYWGEERKYKTFCKTYENAFIELIATGWKPDMIHAQCTADGGIMAMYLSKMFDVPYVIIEHQVFLLSNCSQFKKELIIKALESAKKVGAVSNHQKRAILTNGIKCNPTIVWNFINEDDFKIESIQSDGKFRILSISYPSFIKDMETFFKSMSIFCEQCNDDIEIVVIGDNSNCNSKEIDPFSFEYLAKKHNVFDKCVFISHLEHYEIANILNTASVFVSTSIAETFGVSVREAMMCGVPVICTKSGGVEDSINDKTGVLVNIGDYDAIANALLKIKKKELTYDTDYIRSFVISQCGKNSFISKMKLFYS